MRGVEKRKIEIKVWLEKKRKKMGLIMVNDFKYKEIRDEEKERY